MTEDEGTSFDPKTWLDPKPKNHSAKSDKDDADFNPKTWIDPNILHQETRNPSDNTLAANAPKSSRTFASIAAACMVIAAAIAGSVWLIAGLADEDVAQSEVLADADSAVGSEETPLSQNQPDAPPYQGRQQVLSVSGYQGLIQSLLDLGVPASEANALGRDVVAGLGTDTEEWRVDMWLSEEGKEGEEGKEQSVQFLSASLADGKGVELTRRPNGSFDRQDVFSQVTRELRRANGQMGDHDFYTVAVNSGIPDSLASEFAKVFSYDFSFADEVKSGDEFEAMWEVEVDDRGEEVSLPRLVYARMVTAKGERQYFAFTPPGEIEAQWFSPEGLGNVRSLLRTPVDGARISSKFGFRNHPIRKQRIRHGGVDFAAPTGTPVYASGDSTVQVRRFSRSAGNMVVLDHGEGMVTRYFHLDAFAQGLEIGRSIKQGETIGYVGSTGASTGPHLHYEIIVDGEKLDPLTFDTTTVEPLTGEGMTMFGQYRERLQSELN